MINEIKQRNIAVYGSCITKDPFTTLFNKNYKKYYNCIINDQKHSFISTMQEKCEFNPLDLKILPDDGSTTFLTRCIKEDLEKSFIDLMLSNDIDFLVFDINFEVERGVILFDGDKYLTKISQIEETKFYSTLKHPKQINIIDNPETYFEIWKKYCHEFFNFLKTKCPETRIVLAEVRALDIVQRKDGSTYIESGYTAKSKIRNYYYKKLEDYIKENFDVYVIKFHKDTVLNENHNWGKHYNHYHDEYYHNFLKQMNIIVEFDELKKLKEEFDKHKNIK